MIGDNFMGTKVINFIGLGYVGLPASILLQNSGYQVIGTDINEELIYELASGDKQFEESGMKQIYEDALFKGIKFSKNYQVADTYIVAVPTPFLKETKKIDPSYLIAAIESINEVCKPGALIIIESTISPKTIDKFVRPIFKNKKVDLAHAPERILPGNTLYELKHNSRTVGADTKNVAEQVKQIYQSFCMGEFMLTSIKTAEMTKVIENTFRDINIAFANELKEICDIEGLDVHEVIKIANKHPRVSILSPGTGVGGHCIPVDPWFLVGDYPENTKLIKQAREVNDNVPKQILNKTMKLLNSKYPKYKLGIYGLSYKNNVGDLRESPTIQMYEYMNNQQKSEILFFDPLVDKNIVVNQTFDFDDFTDNVDVILVMNQHRHLFEHEKNIRKKQVILLDPVGVLEGAIHL